MAPEHRNPMQQYIYDQDWAWYQRLCPYLQGQVLKVGNGLGYMASFIAQDQFALKILDIQKNAHSLNQKQVILYDGRHFPFPDQSFDCAVCNYVLHHTPAPYELLAEMTRTARRLIILEETYPHWWAKLSLVRRDIYVNGRADQPSHIYWNSYLKTGDLADFFQTKYRLVYHYREPKLQYFKELYVVDVL